MAEHFWYPSMSVQEIVDAFNGWGMSVTTNQIARPSSEFVLDVYTNCLKQLTTIDDGVLLEPVEAALGTSDTPDMYTQALSRNFLLFHIQRCARAAKVQDFSANDIAFPEPERTRTIFAAFINLVNFSAQCEAFIHGLRHKSSALVEERETVVHQLEETRQQVRSIKEKLAENEPKCEALRKENDKITAHLISCKERQMVILEDVKALKQERATIIKRKEGIQAESESLTDNISRVRSRIVQSPERIKRSIITMGSTAAEDKRMYALQEAKIRDLQSRMSILMTIEQEVRSCVEQLQTIEKETSLLDASNKGLADYKDQLLEKRGEVNELILKRERVHKQLSNAQEKLERAHRHAEDKRIASQQTIERLQREYEEMVNERRDNDRQVEEMRGEAADVERKMAEHLKKSQAELNELLTEYWRLRRETDIYMETLANKLGMQVTTI